MDSCERGLNPVATTIISPGTIVETTDNSDRGMNPVAMTIINPLKEYWLSWGSNQQPPVLKSATLLTELWGLADHVLNSQPVDYQQRVLSVTHQGLSSKLQRLDWIDSLDQTTNAGIFQTQRVCRQQL